MAIYSLEEDVFRLSLNDIRVLTALKYVRCTSYDISRYINDELDICGLSNGTIHRVLDRLRLVGLIDRGKMYNGRYSYQINAAGKWCLEIALGDLRKLTGATPNFGQHNLY